MRGVYGPGMHDWIVWELELGKRAAQALDSHDAWGSVAYAWWQFDHRARMIHERERPTFNPVEPRRRRRSASPRRP